MAAYQKFYAFVENQLLSKIDWNSDVFKICLTAVAPTAATDDVLGDITQISAVGGYTSGGATTTITTGTAAGTITISGTQVVFTDDGSGTFPDFRYAVLYNDTIATPVKPLVAFFDYGSTVNLGASETFTVKFNNASPGTIFTLT